MSLFVVAEPAMTPAETRTPIDTHFRTHRLFLSTQECQCIRVVRINNQNGLIRAPYRLRIEMLHRVKL